MRCAKSLETENQLKMKLDNFTRYCQLCILCMTTLMSCANGQEVKTLGRNKVEPVTSNLIGLPKRGTYVVKEEIEKAPVHNHPCNLTETVVKITFPEMKSEVFMNFLGYKGSNMIYLQRCKGRCSDGNSPVSCTATKIRERKVKMTVSSFLTGATPKEQLKELILDDHVECGCECLPALSSECAGMFNEGTCECECPAWEFREKKIFCEMKRDQYWDPMTCECVGKTIAPRGVDLSDPACDLGMNNDALAGQKLDFIMNSSDTRMINMVVWLLLGASMTLVIVLATSTWHYRTRMINIAHKKKELNGHFYGSDGSIHKEPVVGRSINYSGSIHSLHSCSDIQDHPVSMPRKSLNYKSCENLLQGMPSTQHVEIGGEAFYHPRVQNDNQFFI